MGGAQELLGTLHDLQVLGAAGPDLAFPPSTTDVVDTEMEGMRRWIEREFCKLHSEYVGSRDQLLTICENSLIHAGGIWTERGGETAAGRRSWSAGRVLKMNLFRSHATPRARADAD